MCPEGQFSTGSLPLCAQRDSGAGAWSFPNRRATVESRPSNHAFGIYARPVVSREDRGGQQGREVEATVRDVAARLGLADFVYAPELVARGGGTREPGDALLYANGLGAIVQVKSRSADVGDSDSPERAQLWINKHGSKAHDQAVGTRRQIEHRRSSGEPVLAIPVRAHSLPPAQQREAALRLDMDVSAWPIIVVLDHPHAHLLHSPGPASTFWISLEDWHGLHSAIRSTTGLLSYVNRVLAADPTPNWTLGSEARRFDAFVAADREAADEDGQTAGWLDWATFDDPTGVALFRDVMERVWPSDGALPPEPIEEVRLILEHLDATPPGLAAQLGRWIAEKRRHTDRQRVWASGMFIDDDRLTVYACDDAFNYANSDAFVGRVMALMATRAAEVAEQGRKIGQCAAIGVLTLRPGVDYRFVFASPPPEVPQSIRFGIELEHGVADIARRRTRPVGKLGRNIQCPCGSGKKFKRCHGRT